MTLNRIYYVVVDDNLDIKANISCRENMTICDDWIITLSNGTALASCKKKYGNYVVIYTTKEDVIPIGMIIEVN